MGVIRNVALVVLFISFWTFVAFFGRIPALRNTPIGSLHRTIWIHIPSSLRSVDQRLSNGRISSWISRMAHMMWHDKHPIVMIFFVVLLLVSEWMFLPPAWSSLSFNRKLTSIILVLLPYILLYLSAYTDPGFITPENHAHVMTLYPYDFANYHPGNTCSTCHLLKPARSKHCSICKRCISRLDHHCIFINNCVGYGNIHWFLLLLLSTAFLETYGAYLGVTLVSAIIRAQLPPETGLPAWTLTGEGYTWSQYFNILAWMLQEHTRIGAVTLLCLLTTPLVYGLFGYHIYLLWAGTTTNESMKWSDWKEDIADGCAFKRRLPENRRKDTEIEALWTTWPIEPCEVLSRTDGLPPEEDHIGIGEWEQIWKLTDVENIYDVGLFDSLRDVFLPRKSIYATEKKRSRAGVEPLSAISEESI